MFFVKSARNRINLKCKTRRDASWAIFALGCSFLNTEDLRIEDSETGREMTRAEFYAFDEAENAKYEEKQKQLKRLILQLIESVECDEDYKNRLRDAIDDT